MTPDFSSFKLDLSEDEVGSSKGSGFRSMEPGTHSVKIKQVEWKGAPEKDPSFNKLRITYVNGEGAEISEYLLVPTKSPKYGPSGTLIPFQKVVETLKAIGYDINMKNAAQVMPTVFKNVESLVGRNLNIRTGYKGSYAKYISKNNFNLVDSKTGDNIEEGLNSRDECEASANERGITFSKWPDVMARSAGVNKAPIVGMKKLG